MDNLELEIRLAVLRPLALLHQQLKWFERQRGINCNPDFD